MSADLTTLLRERRWGEAAALCRSTAQLALMLTHTSPDHLAQMVFETALAQSDPADRAALQAIARAVAYAEPWLKHDARALPNLLYNRLLSAGHSADWIAAHVHFPADEPTLALRHPVALGNAVRTIVGGSAFAGCRVLGEGVLTWGDDGALRIYDLGTGNLIWRRNVDMQRVIGVQLIPQTQLQAIIYGADGSVVRCELLDAAETKLRTFKGHTDTVTCCALSSDGRIAVTGGHDNTVRVWDVPRARRIAVFAGHSFWVNAVLISADARLILSASGDGTIGVWDLPDRRFVTGLTAHQGAMVHGAAWLTDDRFCSWDHAGVLMIWDLPTLTPLQRIQAHTGEIKRTVISPDGATLVTAGVDGLLKSWDAVSGALRHTFAGHEGQLLGCRIMPDGMRLISWGLDRTIRVWDLATGAEQACFEGHTNLPQDVDWLEDGTMLISCGADNTLRQWNLHGPAAARRGMRHGSFMRRLRPLGDGRHVVSCGWADDHTARIWDTVTGVQHAALVGHTAAVRDALGFADGTRLLTCGDDYTLRLWDSASGTQLQQFGVHTGTVISCAADPHGAWIAVGCSDGSLHCWKRADHTHHWAVSAHGGIVRHCSVTPDGQTIVTADDTGIVALWQAADGRPIAMRQVFGYRIVALACTATGQVVAAGLKGLRVLALPDLTDLSGVDYAQDARALALTAAGRTALAAVGTTVLAHDVTDGTSRELLHAHTAAIQACRILVGDTLAVSSDKDGVVLLWALADGAVVHRLNGAAGRVGVLAVAPHGTLIAGADSSAIRLWDGHSGALRYSLPLTSEVLALDFSADGSTLASLHTDGTIELRRVADGALAASLPGSFRYVGGLAFLPGGAGSLASWGGDSNLWLRDMHGATIAALGGHGGYVMGCALRDNGDELVSWSYDGTLRRWGMADGRERATLRGHATGILAGCVTPDGATAITGDEDGSVHFWDLAAGRARAVHTDHAGAVYVLISDNSGRWALSGAADGELRLWDVAHAAPAAALRQHTRRIVDAAFTADGTQIVSLDEAGLVCVWNVADGALTLSWQACRGAGNNLALLDGDRVLATSGYDNALRLWRLSDGELLATTYGPARFRDIVPAGEAVCVGDGAGSLWVFARMR